MDKNINEAINECRINGDIRYTDWLNVTCNRQASVDNKDMKKNPYDTEKMKVVMTLISNEQ